MSVGPARPAGPLDLASVHVLVVEDDPTILDLLVDIIQSGGARVTASARADQAFALLEAERPDVLVSDLEMPGHTGLWLIDQVRRLPPERGGGTPAACLTGRTDPEARASILGAGFQYHIPKPVSPSQLLGIVRILALKP